MDKSSRKKRLLSILNSLKPWIAAFVFVLILRFTGLLSGISFLAHSAILKSGIMNFDPTKDVTRPSAFDYNFSLKDLKGNTLNVNELKGKVIFLNLWATWCGPCRVEMPSIQNLYDSTDPEKVVFVMLSLDTEENFAKVTRYVEDKKFTFPVFVPAGPIPPQLRVPSIPTTFVISKDGKIRSKKVGTANYDTEKFKQFLKALAEE